MTHSAIADARGIIIRLHTFGAMDPGSSDHSAEVELDPVRSVPRAHFVAFCSTPGQEPLVRARVAVEESFVPETDSLARS